MLEDVNNILNSGDVPNLYGPEEMDRIMTACRPICAKKRIPATKLNVFAQVNINEGGKPVGFVSDNWNGSMKIWSEAHRMRNFSLQFPCGLPPRCTFTDRTHLA